MEGEEQVVEPQAEVAEAAVEEVQSEEVVAPTEDGLNETEEVHPAEEEEGGTSEQEPDAPEPVYQHEDVSYGDETISTEIAEETYTMLSDAGFDAEELTREMYADGEIGFSEERTQELYEKFGQFQVDLYLKAVSQQMELSSLQNKANQEAVDSAASARWETALEIVGSEDNWTAMEDWLGSAESSNVVTDDQVEAFNEVMEGGSEYMQKLAIADMHNRYTQTLPEEVKELQLLSGDSANQGAGEPTFLTGADYLALYQDGSYHNASAEQKAKWDSLRQNGIDKGV